MLTPEDREALQLQWNHRSLTRTKMEREARKETIRWQLTPDPEPQAPPVATVPALLTIMEAARVLRVSRGTIYHWMHTGKIVVERTPGGHPRIRRASLPEGC